MYIPQNIFDGSEIQLSQLNSNFFFSSNFFQMCAQFLFPIVRVCYIVEAENRIAFWRFNTKQFVFELCGVSILAIRISLEPL